MHWFFVFYFLGLDELVKALR